MHAPHPSTIGSARGALNGGAAEMHMAKVFDQAKIAEQDHSELLERSASQTDPNRFSAHAAVGE